MHLQFHILINILFCHLNFCFINFYFLVEKNVGVRIEEKKTREKRTLWPTDTLA